MLTQYDDVTLARTGRYLRAEFLVQQARYTLEIADQDGPALWALLPDGYERAMKDMLWSLERRLKERTVAAEESRIATIAQNEWMARGKVWRRKVVSRAKRATRFGQDLPDGLLVLGRVGSVEALLGQVIDMVHLLEQYADRIPGGVRDLVEEGRRIAAELSTADAKQEAARLATLPEAVRAFWADKGRLYFGIKAIHDAARELHADDSLKAARYNLSILHRRPSRSQSGIVKTPSDASDANAS